MFLLKKFIKSLYVQIIKDKRIQSIDSVETYAYGTRKDLICKKEKTKCNSIIKQCKK